MVRLVWFPGYMDWERRKYTWEIRGQNTDVRGARSFAQCVSLVKKAGSSLIDVGYCKVESVLAFSMTGPSYES